MKKEYYTPSKKILENYADVLVNFALGKGKGVQKGEVVHLVTNEVAKPLFVELRKAIWKAGGHVISDYRPSSDKEYNTDEDFYLHASETQLNFFAKDYYKGLVNQIDHSLMISSETDLQSLKKIDSKKLMMRGKAMKPWIEWEHEKENAGKFSWTIALYGTEALAKEAKLTEKEYWDQIIKACFLDEKNPIAKWKSVAKSMQSYINKLDALEIEKVHVTGADVDLHIKIGANRKWIGGDGANIPSFEIFTSPDFHDVTGWIKFNQPLYTNGNLIEGIELTFKDGVVIKSTAKKNEKLLKEMIAVEGANRLGEFSMTDRRFSRVTKFMAETLYDENVGGRYGNSHIAIGQSFHEAYKGNIAKTRKATWKKLGYNESVIHCDIITTTDRTVTAYLKNGENKIIFKDGQFCI